ncbi:MAG: ABC transporter substrate-binding protein, partial [Romboutsia sp.]|nr:ABC transporter substrate-binding protein [Romboutsia sp.]
MSLEYNKFRKGGFILKKIIISLICLLLIVLIFIFAFGKKEEKTDLTTVKVAEVAHSIFYAPQYVAINKGYFEEEGINIDLILTPGADAVTATVLSGDVDIGFCGTEATIYVYNGGEKDYLQTFAGLTQKDGSFLVAREKYDKFKISDVKGKTIIGGRKGGMPEMTLEWALKENGIDSKNDVNIDTSVEFSAMQGAFIGGTGDFVTLFEPNALAVEKAGYGKVVAYVGDLGGIVPYTAYNAKKSYIENNKDIIKGFRNAINKGLKYVINNDSKTIAKELVDFFPDTTLSDLEKIVDRYKEGRAWKSDISITEEEWNHIEDIIISAGELDKKVDYNKLIYSNGFEDYE